MSRLVIRLHFQSQISVKVAPQSHSMIWEVVIIEEKQQDQTNAKLPAQGDKLETSW